MDNTRTIISITPAPSIVDTVRKLKRHRYSRAQSNSRRVKNRLSRSPEADIDVDTRRRWRVRNIHLKGDGRARSGQGHSSWFDREGGRGNSMSVRDGWRHRQKREGQSTQEY